MTGRSERAEESRLRTVDAQAPAEPEWSDSDGLEVDGFDCTEGIDCGLLYEAMASPDKVDYVEHGLQALRNTSLSSDGKSAIVRELLGRIVTDLMVPRGAFEAYLGRIQRTCPSGFAAYASEVFRSGHLSVALGMFEQVFLRLASLVERHLQEELGLDRSEHLLMLSEAMRAWAGSRVLQHRAFELSEGGRDILKSAGRLRSQAAAQQKVFLRLFRELRKAGGKA